MSLDAEAELLMRLFEDNKTYARHNEQLRATLVNLVSGGGAVVIGLITLDDKYGWSDLPLCLLLLLMGIYGSLIGHKHYERTRLHLNRASTQLDQLAERFPGAHLKKGKMASYEQNKEMFPILMSLQLNKLWLILPMFISMAGVGLAAVIVIVQLGTGGQTSAH